MRLLWNINASVEQFRNSYPLTANIFTCNDKEPPSRQTANVKQGSAIKSEQPIDTSNLKIFKGTDGRAYKRIDFAIEMKVIGAALEFALLHQGKRIGHSQIEPEVDNNPFM